MRSLKRPAQLITLRVVSSPVEVSMVTSLADLPEPGHCTGHAELAAAVLEELGVHPTDLSVVGDRRRWDMERPEPAGVGLDLPELAGVEEETHTDQAIGLGSPPELIESGELVLRGREDQLPAYLVRYAMVATEPEHLLRPRHAEAGLERAGLVVDARVDDPAVVAALVARDLILLVEDGEAQSRVAARNLQRHR